MIDQVRSLCLTRDLRRILLLGS